MIQRLLNHLRSLEECEVLPPEGLPAMDGSRSLPGDIREFYSLCGGVVLYKQSAYSLSIVQPAEFILANPVIVGELCDYDISSHWYIVGKGRASEYISIDLAPERMGRCYDSFEETHGLAGDCPIIALSFTDLLRRLIDNKGERYYWLEEDYLSLGDAYD